MKKKPLISLLVLVLMGEFLSSCNLSEDEQEVQKDDNFIVEIDDNLTKPVLIVESDVIFDDNPGVTNNGYRGELRANQEYEIVAYDPLDPESDDYSFDTDNYSVTVRLPLDAKYVRMNFSSFRSSSEIIPDLFFEKEPIETYVLGPRSLIRPFRKNIRITLKESCLQERRGSGFSDDESFLGLSITDIETILYENDVIFVRFCSLHYNKK